jgi:hypothetical protein
LTIVLSVLLPKKKDRQYNGQKKNDRQDNGQKKKDIQHNGQKKKDRQYNEFSKKEKKNRQYNGFSKKTINDLQNTTLLLLFREVMVLSFLFSFLEKSWYCLSSSPF